MPSIQSRMQDIKTWLTDNFLLLNDKKTEIVKFGKHYSKDDILIGSTNIHTQPWMHTGRGAKHVYACDSSM